MICARCSHEVGSRARFCEACGAPLLEASAGATTESIPSARLRVYAALLAPVYDLFTDGTDMADVQEARAVLEGLDA